MKPFRKNVAVAIDGGGVRGIIVARALTMLEQELGSPVHKIFGLSAGTSTGSIISAAIACGFSAQNIFDLYLTLGDTVFRHTWRYYLWPLTRYRYDPAPLKTALLNEFGTRKMGDLWQGPRPCDLVITTFDVVDNRTRFIKPWKEEYTTWPVAQAILASSSAPTYFPIVESRYVDGGIGSYANPCYLAAYEAQFCLNWDPAETTLISLGTGRDTLNMPVGQANRFWAWDWISPVMGAFSQSANDQQVHLVNTFFNKLDFRRFQVNLQQPILLDDAEKNPQLCAYGEDLGRLILNDMTDASQKIFIAQAGRSS
jgi:predicted acylesterase/phospholipase RssA